MEPVQSIPTLGHTPSRSAPKRKKIISSKVDSTVASLMLAFTNAWDANTQSFSFSNKPFRVWRHIYLLLEHTKIFTKVEAASFRAFGFIEKFDLSPKENPRIYVRADLHADLKTLIENLKTLQTEGLLDRAFNCTKGVHLVFLGDYCDRGPYGTQTLEMLMRLREENPEQVHLIRGNHEDVIVNQMYSETDDYLKALIGDPEGAKALANFYQTLPLTTYFSLGELAQREYIQCTHGLFEPSMDPAPLLDDPESKAYVFVPVAKVLSERISLIANNKSSKLYQAAMKVQDLVLSSPLESEYTAYNWADVIYEKEDSELGSIRERAYKLNAEDIQAYLNLSSEHHRVEMIFRGHQHKFEHLIHNKKVLVTTLSVGMDGVFKRLFNQADCAYILNVADKIKNWTKRAILKNPGDPVTEVTDPYPLTSDFV